MRTSPRSPGRGHQHFIEPPGDRLVLADDDAVELGHDGGKPLGVYLLESAAIVPSQLLAALDESARLDAVVREQLRRLT